MCHCVQQQSLYQNNSFDIDGTYTITQCFTKQVQYFICQNINSICDKNIYTVLKLI